MHVTRKLTKRTVSATLGFNDSIARNRWQSPRLSSIVAGREPRQVATAIGQPAFFGHPIQTLRGHKPLAAAIAAI